MKDFIVLYNEFVRLKIKSAMEDRLSLLLGGLAQSLSYGAEFLLIWIVVNEFKVINGWLPYEVVFLYAINLFTYAIAAFFLFNPFTQLSNMIKNGSFDEILTKPLNSFGYLICREVNAAYYSHFIFSLVIMYFCYLRLNINLSIIGIVHIVSICLGGALIQGAGLILTSVPAFWLIENNSVRNVLYFKARGFIQYPISIYSKGIQVILTFILPYAFINFYPSIYLFEKNNESIFFGKGLVVATPLVGSGLFIVALLFWQLGIKHYKSTGS